MVDCSTRQKWNGTTIRMMPSPFHQAPIYKKVLYHDILHFGSTHNVSIVYSGQRSCPVRATTGARLAAALAAEKLDEFGNPVQSTRRRLTQPLKPRAIAKRKRPVDDAETDVDDDNFVASTEDGSDDDSDVME
jgi:hypothetical protein